LELRFGNCGSLTGFQRLDVRADFLGRSDLDSWQPYARQSLNKTERGILRATNGHLAEETVQWLASFGKKVDYCSSRIVIRKYLAIGRQKRFSDGVPDTNERHRFDECCALALVNRNNSSRSNQAYSSAQEFFRLGVMNQDMSADHGIERSWLVKSLRPDVSKAHIVKPELARPLPRDRNGA
jgi:hypothetical protein